MLKKPDISGFIQNIQAYSQYYSPQALFEKIKNVGRSLGIKSVYLILILYYASFDKSLPLKDRMMVIAALGYFILPLDLIPDALPGGFADDTAALMYVVKHIWNNLSEDTYRKAAARLREWFDNVSDEDLKLPGIGN